MKKINKIKKYTPLLTGTQVKVLSLLVALALTTIYGVAWLFSSNRPARLGTGESGLYLSDLVIMVFNFCFMVAAAVGSFILLPLGGVLFFIAVCKGGSKKIALTLLALGVGCLIVQLFLLPLFI